jgi:hypothetical protein
MSDYDQIGGDDLVFYSVGSDNIYSGGFSIDSPLMKGGVSPMKSINDPANDASAFKGVLGQSYVIPPMWFLSTGSCKIGGSTNYEKNKEEDSEIIGEDLHEKLLRILEESQKKSKKGTSKLLVKSDKKRTRKAK